MMNPLTSPASEYRRTGTPIFDAPFMTVFLHEVNLQRLFESTFPENPKLAAWLSAAYLGIQVHRGEKRIARSTKLSISAAARSVVGCAVQPCRGAMKEAISRTNFS